jgi:hypothetical protein
MGLFGKERHGSMLVLADGRAFCWTLPNFSKYPFQTTLDSEYVMSFRKVKFHFHMTIGPRGDVGFYLHYRDPPIPKYSYYLQNATGETMRQQTAHTIPKDAERCGHWNMATLADMKSFLQQGGSDTLQVFFSFDDDRIGVEGIEDTRVTWTVPNLLSKRLNPFTSPGFSVQGSLYVLRIDVKPTSGDFVLFVFCRKGTLPPHSIAVMSPDGGILAQLERKDELGAQTLVIPHQHLLDTIGRGNMEVVLTIFKNANPLDFFNQAGAPPPSIASPERKYADVGNEQYIVFSDDL